MPTTVVNLYKTKEYDVYIGRAGKGQDGYFGNPFHGPNRDENIVKFKEYFANKIRTDPEYRKRIIELKDKTLACFCKPAACHGDVIATYLNSLPDVKPCKLAVVGSRTFRNYQFLCNILQWYDIALIISGGAKGADSLAEKYALEHGIQTKIFPADWDRYGKRAGYLRNEKIVAACDEVVAFWDGTSAGTAHTIRIANEQGKPVNVFWPEEKTLVNDDDDDDDFLMKVGSHVKIHSKGG